MADTSINARLGLNSAQFTSGLNTARSQVTRFTAGASSQFVAAAGVAGMGAMIQRAVDLGGGISDLAVQLSVGTTGLQTLQFAAQQAGVSSSTLHRAMRNVNMRTQDAVEGSTLYNAAFTTLGISLDEFVALPLEGKFEMIGVAIDAAGSSQEAFNAAADILGTRAGPELTEVLQTLADDGLSGVEAAALSAGQIMSEDAVNAMDGLSDSIAALNTQLTVLTAEFTQNVLPVFTIFSNGIGAVGNTVGNVGAQFTAGFENAADAVGVVTQPLSSLMDGMSTLFSVVTGGGSTFDDLGTVAAAAADSMASIPEGLTEVWAQNQSDADAASEVWWDMIGERSESITSAFNTMIGQSESTLNTVGENVSTSAEVVEGAINDLTDSELDRINTMEDAAASADLSIDYSNDSLDAAADAASDAADAASSSADVANSAAEASAAAETGATAVEDAVTDVSDTIEENLGVLETAVDDAIDSMNETLDTLVDNDLLSWLSEKQDTIISHLQSIDEEVNRNP